MTTTTRTIKLGTRGSALARWQTDHIAALLRQHHADLHTEIVIISTQGDRVIDVPLPEVGGKGMFTAELEDALRRGDIDFAVHSLKDLPTEAPAGLAIGAIPIRASAQDVLVSRAASGIDALPQGAAIGTSSLRRAGQLLHTRPDLQMIDIRGNVDTRIKKALDPDSPYDAIVLAHAGLQRLAREETIREVIALETMLPAPGQGALAVQCRDEPDSLALLAPLDDLPTRCAVTAERAFLSALGGGCAVPVAAHAVMRGPQLRLHGRVISVDGVSMVDTAFATYCLAGSELQAAAALGQHLAEMALQQGARAILEAGD
jgi:hydroxymethylbilane synthase